MRGRALPAPVRSGPRRGVSVEALRGVTGVLQAAPASLRLGALLRSEAVPGILFRHKRSGFWEATENAQTVQERDFLHVAIVSHLFCFFV